MHEQRETKTDFLIEDPQRIDWARGGPRPLRAHVRRPTGPGPHPLVLMSHGTGGCFEDLDWLTDALAEAGFMVAGVDHHGNTAVEPYLPPGFAFVWERPRDLAVLLGEIVEKEDVDEKRIGVVGFSLGGYTAAAALGARIAREPALAVLTGLIETPPLREFPDLVAHLAAQFTAQELQSKVEEGGGDFRIASVRAGFLIAPAICEMLDPASLAAITAPVEVRWGGADDEAVPQRNAEKYVALMPAASGASVGADIGHYEFAGQRADATRVRERVIADAIAFFTRTLAPRSPRADDRTLSPR